MLSRDPRPGGQTERAPRGTPAPAGWAQQHSTGRRMCGCVSTSGEYVLHQRQFWHMQRLQGASSIFKAGATKRVLLAPGILSALLHQRANAQRLQRGTSSRQAQLQPNSLL